MQKAIGYIRVSTQGQAEEGVSMAAQRAKIDAWCIANDMELVAVFEDAGVSGGSMAGREGLHAAMKATTKVWRWWHIRLAGWRVARATCWPSPRPWIARAPTW